MVVLEKSTGKFDDICFRHDACEDSNVKTLSGIRFRKIWRNGFQGGGVRRDKGEDG